MMKKKYRVVEMQPNYYVIELKHWWLGWEYVAAATTFSKAIDLLNDDFKFRATMPKYYYVFKDTENDCGY